MINFGDVPAGTTLYIPFASYDGDTGASVTLTGLAVTDIEIYKNGSTTQRSSDSGYALLDTDGIDFDGITGIHGFSIDLSDNTDAGFYSVGAQYWIIVNSVTIDGQTVSFIAATFRIVAAENVAGVPVMDIGYVDGTAYSLADNIYIIHSGTAQAGASTTITLDTEASSVDNFYNGCYVQIVNGTGAGQARFIPEDPGSYVGSTRVATVHRAWATNPDSSSEFILWPFGVMPATQETVDDLKSGIIFGAAATGTLSTTQATTDLTGYTDDQLIGRVIIWRTGNCEGEATVIRDYANTSGLLTFDDLTTVPSNGDTFKIV